VYVAEDVPVAFVAVIVYVVAESKLEGVPVNFPVAESNEVPAGAAGDIPKLATVPPAVASTVYPAIAEPRETVSNDVESEITGAGTTTALTVNV